MRIFIGFARCVGLLALLIGATAGTAHANMVHARPAMAVHVDDTASLGPEREAALFAGRPNFSSNPVERMLVARIDVGFAQGGMLYPAWSPEEPVRTEARVEDRVTTPAAGIGSHLPQPTRGAAIVATLALAAFFFVRRLL